MADEPAQPMPETGWKATWGGASLLGLAALLLLVGLLKTINLITFLACALIAMWGLNWLVALLQLRQFTARWMPSGPLVAERPGIRNIEIVYSGKMARIGVRLDSKGADAKLGWGLAYLDAGERRALRGRLVFAKRGRYQLAPLVLSTGYPFGMVKHWRTLAPATEVIVWPRMGTLHRGRFRRRLRITAEVLEETRARPRYHAAAQASFYGLRAYRPGDSPRTIHWRSSARRGELMVREFEDPAGEDLIVVLDTTTAGSRAFEKAVQLTATICHEWCRMPGARFALVVAGNETEVVRGETGPTLARRLMDRLATVTTCISEAPALANAPPEMPSGSVVVVAAGSSRVADILRRVWQRPVSYVDALARDSDFYRPPG